MPDFSEISRFLEYNPSSDPILGIAVMGYPFSQLQYNKCGSTYNRLARLNIQADYDFKKGRRKNPEAQVKIPPIWIEINPDKGQASGATEDLPVAIEQAIGRAWAMLSDTNGMALVPEAQGDIPLERQVIAKAEYDHIISLIQKAESYLADAEELKGWWRENWNQVGYLKDRSLWEKDLQEYNGYLLRTTGEAASLWQTFSARDNGSWPLLQDFYDPACRSENWEWGQEIVETIVRLGQQGYSGGVFKYKTCPTQEEQLFHDASQDAYIHFLYRAVRYTRCAQEIIASIISEAINNQMGEPEELPPDPGGGSPGGKFPGGKLSTGMAPPPPPDHGDPFGEAGKTNEPEEPEEPEEDDTAEDSGSPTRSSGGLGIPLALLALFAFSRK